MKFYDKAEAEIVAEKLNDLTKKVPCIVSLETGIDFLHSARSYDLALIVTFNSKEDLDAYRVHPDHKDVQKYIHSVRESAVAVDFEF